MSILWIDFKTKGIQTGPLGGAHRAEPIVGFKAGAMKGANKLLGFIVPDLVWVHGDVPVWASVAPGAYALRCADHEAFGLMAKAIDVLKSHDITDVRDQRGVEA